MKMGVSEMMGVLQAYATGGCIIEYRPTGSTNESHWVVTQFPAWNFMDYEYRVKPQPKEVWICMVEGSDTDVAFVSTDKFKTEHFAAIKGRKVYHMVEKQ